MSDDPGYQCGFCEEPIRPDEYRNAVILTAANMDEWIDEKPELSSQSFWAHFECLKRECKVKYGWSADALIDLQ